MSKALWTTTFPNQMPKKSERRKRISPISKSQRAKLLIYSRQRIAFLREHKRCAVFPNLRATEIHHQRGRAGSLLLDIQYWLAVSFKGHRWIHDNINEARKGGFIAEAGDWGKTI
jgi:hypothetical protein